MKIRTGDGHPFDEDEVLVDQFKVGAKPWIDYAAKALREAQDAYYAAYPEARKKSREHLWEIRKEPPE
jgi:hypothetical protein